MTSLPVGAGRRCHNYLNAIHSTVYFSPELGSELGGYGVHDPMAAYFMGRAAPLGEVGPGTITATFHGFKHDLIAGMFPGLWRLVPPEMVVAARLRAADVTLRRALGDDAIDSPAMKEAAELASHARGGCVRAARPLYSAHADLPDPDAPHLLVWHVATLLREYRGDAHFTVLANAELDGLEALVSHSASADGMPREMVMTKRGWTQEDWSAAEDRLRARGLMDFDGTLTERGRRLRIEIEAETDRLDRGPYEFLGPDGVERLTELAASLTMTAAAAGAFPPPLVDFFTRG